MRTGIRTDSLRVQLLLWVLLPLVGVLSFNLWASHRAALATADLVTDRMLLASARAIAEAVRLDQGAIDAIVPPVALEMFDTGHHDRAYYRVETAEGRLLTGYPDLPVPKGVGEGGEEARYRDQPVRLTALSYPVIGAGPVRVVTGVTLRSHSAMVRRAWLSAAAQQVGLLFVAAILTLIGLQRGLGPVLRLRDAVLKRGDTLVPFEPADVQAELRPLVEALNEYQARVHAQLGAQRRFVANAAHQLRTPLALLSTQSAYAARERDPERRQEALEAMRTSTRQVARLAGQLLALARAEPGSRRPRADRVDLAETARQVLEAHAEAALSGGRELALEAETPVFVIGDGMLLGEMIGNLVDNALRYTPEGGSVTVAVSRRDGEAVLAVQDSGPGIAEAEREAVFERFYRLPGTQAEGSGLGLAIVREVVDGAGGAVELADAPGGGLIVRVVLSLEAAIPAR